MTRDQLAMGKELEKRIDNLVKDLKTFQNILDKKDNYYFLDTFVLHRDIMENLKKIQKEAVVTLIKNYIKSNIEDLEQVLKNIKTTEE